MSFRNFDDFLDGKAGLEVDQSGTPSTRELKITITAVLYKVIAADDCVTADELNMIVRLLNKQFGLINEDSGYFVEVAHTLLDSGALVDTLLEKVRDNYAESQRETILAMIWKLMNADGFVSRPEIDYATHATRVLGLSAENVQRAKRRAEANEV